MATWTTTVLSGYPGSVECFSQEDLAQILINEQGAGLHPWRESDFLSSIANGHYCLGVKREGNWEAHAILSSAIDELELLIIAVASSSQRQGLARAFLEHIIQSASEQGYRVIHLEVRASNIGAITLYESLKFEQVGLRRHYYARLPSEQKDKEDALVFSLYL